MLCVLYVFMSHVPYGILVGSLKHGGRGVPVSTVSFVTPVQGQESYSIPFVFISGYRLATINFSSFLYQGACSRSQAAFVKS